MNMPNKRRGVDAGMARPVPISAPSAPRHSRRALDGTRSRMKRLRKLLVGTWKSDKRLTLDNCHRYHGLNGAKKRRFGSMFGRLVLRYTRSQVHHSLRGTEWTAKYDVIAADSDSIVLRIHSDDLWKRVDPIVADILKQVAQPRLQQLHFRRRKRRQYYWIGCGMCCEWFRRLDIQPSGFRQRRARAAVSKRKPLARRA